MPPGSRVLDVGCGSGHVAASLVAAGHVVHAVDPDPQMVALATSRSAADVRRGGLPDLPYDDASFDAVVANFVLNHVDDPRAAARGLAPVTRPGGHVVASIWPAYVPPQATLWSALLDDAGAVRPDHAAAGAGPGLRALARGPGRPARAGGLRVVEVGTTEWDWRVRPDDFWAGVTSVGNFGVAWRRPVDRGAGAHAGRLRRRRGARGATATTWSSPSAPRSRTPPPDPSGADPRRTRAGGADADGRGTDGRLRRRSSRRAVTCWSRSAAAARSSRPRSTARWPAAAAAGAASSARTTSRPGSATRSSSSWTGPAADGSGCARVGVLLLVVLAGVLWSLRPQPPAVAEQPNPLPVPWYDGTDLHLAEVRVTLPDLGPFVADGDGVIVRRDGEVQRVDADGDVSAYSGSVDFDRDTTDHHPAARPQRPAAAVGGRARATRRSTSWRCSAPTPRPAPTCGSPRRGGASSCVCTPYSCVTRLVEPGARLR